jgi:hypothetical protein
MTLGSHNGSYEDCFIMDRDAVQSGENAPQF